MSSTEIKNMKGACYEAGSSNNLFEPGIEFEPQYTLGKERKLIQSKVT